MPIFPASGLEEVPVPAVAVAGGGRRVSCARLLPLSSGAGLAESGVEGAWGWVKPGMESSSKSSSSVQRGERAENERADADSAADGGSSGEGYINFTIRTSGDEMLGG